MVISTFLALGLSMTWLSAEVSPVDVSVLEDSVWVGERVEMIVKLRAKGSFSGTANFDLPEIPASLMIKTGNPVVGSEDIEGESWFVQSHRFSLFSQVSGTLEIPSFMVRFQAKDGFTGPSEEVEAETAPLSVEIRRPAGSEEIPFLVTSSDLQISEKWDPVPGEEDAKVGDVFRRTIIQTSRGLSGIALLPAPTEAPAGVRVYEPSVEIKDETNRGAFQGERQETLAYLLQEPGEVILPEFEFTWWNPEKETFETERLPAISLKVAPATDSAAGGSAIGLPGWQIVFVVMVGVVLVWQRSMLAILSRRVRRYLRPPDRVAAKALHRACLRNDAVAAQSAWNRWLLVTEVEFTPIDDLRVALQSMQRSIYGPTGSSAEFGEDLWQAFSEQLSREKKEVSPSSEKALPALNSIS
ncbi:MAG: hypothetical protein AAF357_03990 [Verrucomicrobiota bacterium]